MITLSNNTKGLDLLHQVEEIYGKVYTSDSLLETVLCWGINCTCLGMQLPLYTYHNLARKCVFKTNMHMNRELLYIIQNYESRLNIDLFCLSFTLVMLNILCTKFLLTCNIPVMRMYFSSRDENSVIPDQMVKSEAI